MARIPYGNDTQPEHAELINRIKSERSRMSNLYRMLLNSPSMCEGWLHLLTNVRQKSTLDGKVRELVICVAGAVLGSEYEYRAHAAIALKEGVTQAQLDVLLNASPGVFTPEQQAAIDYAIESTKNVQVADATFENLRKHYGPEQIVEITVTCGAYNMVSRLLVALQVDMES